MKMEISDKFSDTETVISRDVTFIEAHVLAYEDISEFIFWIVGFLNLK